MVGIEAIKEYLDSLRGKGSKLGLERVIMLLNALKNPQNSFNTILVGGTSGKGSTASMLSSIIKEAGYNVGTFTSPHISKFTERIMVNGKEISEKELVEEVEEIKNVIEGIRKQPGFEQPTFFEVITAVAFLYFKKQKVDFAVLEVGLGGRLDATNVVSPSVSIITNVSLEHTKILGSTLQKIAKEKAGIIRENGILVTAADNEGFMELQRICRKKNAKLIQIGSEVVISRIGSDLNGQNFNVRVGSKNYENLYIPLLGKHQLENAGCAIGAVDALESYGIVVAEEAIFEGLKNVKWPGRLEILQEAPLVVLDCAKDLNAMRKLKETIIEDFKYDRVITVLSISSDKDIKRMTSEIGKISDVVIATAHTVMNRAADPKIIAEKASKRVENVFIEETIGGALKKALSMAKKNDLVLITGSVFTVAEARGSWYTIFNNSD